MGSQRAGHDWETFTFTHPPLQPPPWRAEQTAASGQDSQMAQPVPQGHSLHAPSFRRSNRTQNLRARKPRRTRPSSLLSFGLGRSAPGVRLGPPSIQTPGAHVLRAKLKYTGRSSLHVTAGHATRRASSSSGPYGLVLLKHSTATISLCISHHLLSFSLWFENVET